MMESNKNISNKKKDSPDGDNNIRISDADAAYTDIIDVDPNVHIINRFQDEIGMGRYQWNLWVLCGLGWIADQMLLQMLAIIQPRTAAEMGLSGLNTGATQACYFAGLAIGATFWGVGADTFGRKLAFNITLLTAGLFGTILGGQMNLAGLTVFALLMGTGTGGNLPLDGAIYLEASPKKDQRILMLMSLFWCLGQFFASIVAYGVIPKYSCVDDTDCAMMDNRGWRWACIILGGFTLLMWCSRFFLFTFYESPKYLLSIGNYEGAARSLNGIAKYNKRDLVFDVEMFEIDHDRQDSFKNKKSMLHVFKEQLAMFGPNKMKPLFATKKMALTTIITWFLWIDIQIGYSMFNGFLPAYLEAKGAGVTKTLSESYLEFYISVCGIPGAALAMFAVEIPYIGRKGTMCISAVFCALCLVLFAYLTSSGGQLAAGCIQSFFQNIFYAVLYAYSPEVFPTYVRGTAVGMASMLARVFGAVWVPLATGYLVEISVNIPLIMSAVCFGLLAPACLLLPIETKGKHAM